MRKLAPLGKTIACETDTVYFPSNEFGQVYTATILVTNISSRSIWLQMILSTNQKIFSCHIKNNNDSKVAAGMSAHIII